MFEPPKHPVYSYVTTSVGALVEVIQSPGANLAWWITQYPDDPPAPMLVRTRRAPTLPTLAAHAEAKQ